MSERCKENKEKLETLMCELSKAGLKLGWWLELKEGLEDGRKTEKRLNFAYQLKWKAERIDRWGPWEDNDKNIRRYFCYLGH